MGETGYAVCAPTPTAWIMAALKDMQRGWTTEYDNHTEDYSASDAKGWVTLHRSAWETTRGKDTNTGLLPRQVNIKALPMIKLLIDGRRCMALVDSKCSKTLMYKLAYCSWRPREAKVVTADRKTLTSLSIGTR